MKKAFFILFTFLMWNSSVIAQKIDRDYFNDGYHHVLTKWQEMPDDKDESYFFVKLQGTQESNKTFFHLVFKPTRNESFSFFDGGKLLVKTTDGNVITLVSDHVTATEYDVVDYIFKVPMYRFYSIVSFPISEEQLDKISEGILKLRFEMSGQNNLEYTYKKDKIGKHLKKAKQIIVNSLKNRKSFEDGF